MSYLPSITQAQDVRALIPQTALDIENLVETTCKNIESSVENIINISLANRTFDNTARALDGVVGQSHVLSSILQLLQMVSPDEQIRKSAEKALLLLQNFLIEEVSHNVKLFQALQDYAHHNARQEKLDEQERYYLTRILKEGERNGLNLPAQRHRSIKQLEKEIAEISNQFDLNIAADTRTLSVSSDALQGLSDTFIKNLAPDEQGNYKVGVDYPTYYAIMEQCTVEKTRHDLWHLFMNRGYPANEKLLNMLIELRDKLARKLGYTSYATYSLEDEMAKSPETVQDFLDDLQERAIKKLNQEVELLKAELPEGISLTAQGKFKPWDIAFIKDSLKKRDYAVDENEIAAYFPLENTLAQLLAIYEEFFNISFEQVQLDLWHPDVRIIAAYSKDHVLLGYLALDLFPRSFKYNHACEITIVPATKDKANNYYAACAVVIANFPKPTDDQPALLQRNDVRTFFHEFGHALHTLLGATEMINFSGTHVKHDFVEMPSQMLEEWLWDAAILKKVSSHYQTNKPLSDDLITQILRIKHFDSGDWVMRQIYLSFISLQLFQEGAKKNIQALKKSLHEQLRPHIMYETEHFEASFGHLTHYNARYYSYLWSKVFALDLFNYIKEFGLLNPVIGQRYAQEILGKGGSVEPYTLLCNFLGRKPTSLAFFKDLGIK
ncbi:MAG: M3 family metallopeptidase [Candidatus Babeliaceae bacterium]